MYVFLQNFRATLIPTIAVPVVLLGTFGILAVAGFSINTLTMFGMVLAIGLLVDDAIVVVENVERVMEEDKLSPREAARKSMGQITGALVGIALVLAAVFLPMAFFSGSTGVIYRQFSITIVSAMALSVAVALILTPALCATLLKHPQEGELKHHGGFFGWFNRNFDRMNHGYSRSVGHVVHRTWRYFLVYAVIVILMGVLFIRIPKSFLPDEDQGVLFAQVVAPPGTPVEVTEKVLDQPRTPFLQESGVQSCFTVSGFSFGGHGQGSGLAFVSLKGWGAARGKGDNTANAIVARAKLLEIAAKNPAIGLLRANGLDDEPQYQLDIDWEKASALGVPIPNITDSLQAGWGSSYINQFLDRGRVKKVFIQGDLDTRMLPQDLDRWYVRNSAGTMTPFSAFSTA